MCFRSGVRLLSWFVVVACAACAHRIDPSEWATAAEAGQGLDASVREARAEPFPAAALQPVASPSLPTEEYRLGPGDEVMVRVHGRAELCGSHRLGPDAALALPLVGTLSLAGMTRNEASVAIRTGLAPFFAVVPTVGVEVTRYENNRVYVLGRVERPGAVELRGSGTLLQVLSEAGGLPVREFRSFLATCSILRGRDQILQVDLTELLHRGNLALNVPLRNGDVVFVPDAEDAFVFVMGEVRTPGAVAMRTQLDVVQALAQVGGPTDDADLAAVWLLRRPREPQAPGPVRIDFRRLLEEADFRQNLQLGRGDVLYVARSGLGDVGYVLRTVQPALTTLILGAAVAR